MPRPEPRETDAVRSISVALSDRTIAALQLSAAEIRYRSGFAITSSAIVRALVEWLAEFDLDTRAIGSADDLRRALEGTAAGGREERAG